ncbi:MAG: glutaredoxin family protein [Candidatus Syntropharchaeia archaeon]
MKPGVRIYTTPTCPNCEKVKNLLRSRRIHYEEVNMTTPEALTELRMNNVFTMSAPVLCIGDVFLTVRDLFDGDELKEEKILEYLEGLHG